MVKDLEVLPNNITINSQGVKMYIKHTNLSYHLRYACVQRFRLGIPWH
jgi:hypothetical protein